MPRSDVVDVSLHLGGARVVRKGCEERAGRTKDHTLASDQEILLFKSARRQHCRAGNMDEKANRARAGR